MNQIKLIATDLDGTFLDKNGQYDRERLQRLLDQLDNQGIRFMAASGRPIRSLKKEFAGFENRMLFLGENGAKVVDKDDIIYEELMPKETYLEITQTIDQMKYGSASMLHLSGKEGCYYLSTIDPDYLEWLKPYYPIMIEVEDFAEVEGDIYKVGANFPPEHLQEISQQLTQMIPGVVALTSGFECLDVMLDYVDKGNALEQACTALGIELSQVLAFGDNFNDKQMLERAGLAVVPENAKEEIKALADVVIADHTQASVIAYMEEIAWPSN